MTVVATGSIAFDRLLTFTGDFRDHIRVDQESLNVSLLVDSLETRRGGVAANYAYTLALLGYPVAILATVGADGAEYREWLRLQGIDVRGLRVVEQTTTAAGYTTTDSHANQITAYWGGAMRQAAEFGLDDTVEDPEVVIVGPNDPAAMQRLVRECRARGVRWVYDPSHQLPHSTRADLVAGAEDAWMLIGNHYENAMIRERTGRDIDGLLELASMVVTTRGAEGSRIDTRSGGWDIPAAPVDAAADPTGGGDAYRAGLVAGLLRGLDVPGAGRVAAVAAAYVVERIGTVEHRFTHEEFAVRYLAAFGEACPPGLFGSAPPPSSVHAEA